ncbi:FAD-dependent monooxygenase [Nonomuraea sp. NBC_01738]|uniref:FAD-dependent monooxygenase n=1 Tax=Nonomuraea sp. NBC_01738 TaxID=2976003 RepID=UPI002E1346D5|nr:FAD-dependent monooxygenase [Nonomuraea sp. NBC_01738]
MNVLISGASVAGPALACFLRAQGVEVTVVERAPGLRRGGQAIDIRGAALQVAERMGILDAARALKTDMRGMSMHDGDGNEIMRTTEETISGGRLDSPDIEIMRDDLTRLIMAATSGVEYLWDDSIATLTQDAGQVHVTFERGASRTFDLVVGADGMHSNTRRLLFGAESQFVEHLGTHVAIFTADNFLGLDRWQVWHREGAAGFGIYTVPGNAHLRVNLGFEGGAAAYDHRDVEQQRRLVAERCAGLRWIGPKLIEAMWQADDFYFDAMAQVHLERWSEGRVALLGDAAYCASPMSGQGTSLALVGAYVLADEIGRSGCFGRYQERMAEFVALNQALAKENPGQGASPESVAHAASAITL